MERTRGNDGLPAAEGAAGRPVVKSTLKWAGAEPPKLLGSAWAELAPSEGDVLGTAQFSGYSEPMAAIGSVPGPAGWAAYEPQPGARLGQYELIRELGAGGMGTVFLARDAKLGRRVAIKFLQTLDEAYTQRFLVEAQATARCNHENIVVIYEVGELSGSPFMVLEYLEGQSLSALMRKHAPLTPSRAVELVVPIARALASAHALGIVHRDLKPDNVLLTDAGSIKVLDFGIAKVLKDEPREDLLRRSVELSSAHPQRPDLTAGGLVGTMAYMSPEQWGVGGPIDHQTDIWALGLILFQLLTNTHPFEEQGPNPFHFVSQLDLPLPRLRDVAPEVPEALADVVDRCLMKRKAQRIQDAPALLRELEPFLPGRFRPRIVTAEEGPYAGLRAFQEEDADRFFGRGREIAALVTRIRDWPLLAVVGPSGVGKSSFVRAGLMPALKGSGEKWETLVLRPGRDPFTALALALAPTMGTSASLLDDLSAQQALADRLAAEPGHLGNVLRGQARREGIRYLLFVDQFEELYSLGSLPATRLAFTACLAAAADDATSPVRVVLSVRSDFLDRVAEDPHFMNELTKGLTFLGPPTREGLRDALVQPPEMLGYRFEQGDIVDDMLSHLESAPAALPLLQFTAAQLWDLRDPTRRLLTRQSYRTLGGIAGALARHADRVIGKLSADGQTLARALFLALITPERTRALRELPELSEIGAKPQEMEQLVSHLVESRLLVVQTPEGQAKRAATVEIVHESLVTSWPTLRRWLDDNHEDSVFLEQLRAAARQWHAKQRDSGLLWGGEMVEELERFMRREPGPLPESTRAFVKAAIAQKDRRAKLRRTLTLGAVSGVSMLLVAAVVALVVIRNAQTKAERSAVVARRAEAAAQQRLLQVEAKERERRAAEALQRAAEREAAAANTQVAITNEELAKRNEELTAALERTEEERLRAQKAKLLAEENERAARDAEERARSTAGQLEKLLGKERERADRLTEQLGSPLVEWLR